MVVCQILTRVNDSMHICFHQISNNINVFISRLLWWFLHIHQPDNVLMIEEFQRRVNKCKIKYTENMTNQYHLLSSLISLTILFASIKSSNALGTFLMATFAFIEWSIAEHTTPQAPCPICFMYSYLSCTKNYVPLQF